MEKYRLILQLNNEPNAEFRFWDAKFKSFRILPLIDTIFENEFSKFTNSAARIHAENTDPDYLEAQKKAVELFKKSGYDLTSLKWVLFWEKISSKFEYIKAKKIS